MLTTTSAQPVPDHCRVPNGARRCGGAVVLVTMPPDAGAFGPRALWRCVRCGAVWGVIDG